MWLVGESDSITSIVLLTDCVVSNLTMQLNKMLLALKYASDFSESTLCKNLTCFAVKVILLT